MACGGPQTKQHASGMMPTPTDSLEEDKLDSSNASLAKNGATFDESPPTGKRAPVVPNTHDSEHRDIQYSEHRRFDIREWHWNDANGDCRNTLQELLAKNSRVKVDFETERRCEVSQGEWVCAYTGRVLRNVDDVSVDYLVPLHNAHESGGSTWDRKKREAFANDLDFIMIVSNEAKQAKAGRAPDEWLPDIHPCRYVRRWVTLKLKYQLLRTPRVMKVFLRACRKQDHSLLGSPTSEGE